MSDLVTRASLGLTRPNDRAVRRDLAQVGAYTAVEAAKIQSGEILSVRRLQAIETVAGEALQVVAHISLQTENLKQMIPSAAAHLTAVVNGATIAALGVVGSVGRR